MSDSFNSPPTYNEITKNPSLSLSDIWQSWYSTNWNTLIQYLSENGIFLPQLTTAERDALLSPQLGQMIYNTTTDAPQIWQAGAWKTFTTT